MQQPTRGDPVLPKNIERGEPIFIQHLGQKEPELGIFLFKDRSRVLFQSFSEPDGRIYDFYVGDGWMPNFFRVDPDEYMSVKTETYRTTDWYKYLRKYTDNLRFLRERIGEKFFFQENRDGSLYDFVLGTLIRFSMSPSGNYTLTFEDESGRKHTRHGDISEKPAIYDGTRDRRPLEYTTNNLLGPKGVETLINYGPVEGAIRIKNNLRIPTLRRRLPVLQSRKNVQHELLIKELARKEAEAAAGGGGGGGGGSNTTKGGRRRRRRGRKTRK
jgi:hypothetical protein